jgi:hypothetical protein
VLRLVKKDQEEAKKRWEKDDEWRNAKLKRNRRLKKQIKK